MRTIGNILWVIFGGAIAALLWVVIAAIFAVTIVGIPFARQCLKLARFTLWPFGRTTVHDPDVRVPSPIGNIFWVVLVGWWLAIGYFINGALWCLTILGIPFGLQDFKLGSLAFAPFGRRVVRFDQLRAGEAQGNAPLASGAALPPPAPPSSSTR